MSGKCEAAFRAGFAAGSTEQNERDFPDVGFRFDKTVEQYWEEYKKENEEEEGQ